MITITSGESKFCDMGRGRYDTHRQSIVLTMWTPAVNIAMTCKTDEDLAELLIDHKVML